MFLGINISLPVSSIKLQGASIEVLQNTDGATLENTDGQQLEG